VRWQDMPSDRSAYGGKRVVLLGRDVRDNLVSAYFQATKRIGLWRGPLSPFLRDDRFGVDKILAFYRIWWESRHIPGQFLFLRYEDLHRDAAATLARVLPFLGIEAGTDAIATAVDYCRFDNLRQAETEGRFGSSVLAAKDPSDLDSYKVRKGKVGNFGEYMTAEDIAYVESAIAGRGCEFTRPGMGA
jgi:Sulfotransferase domain